MMRNDLEKPPLGCMPKRLWLQSRAAELVRAIHEYMAAGDYNDKLFEWLEELAFIIQQLKQPNTSSYHPGMVNE